MKNLHAILPRPQELNESVRNPEQVAEIQRTDLMIEPKFDGSFIYITRDGSTGKTILCTKDGNELNLEPAVQKEIIEHFQKQGDFLFEAELEPVPWTEEAKVKLNGNLYSGAKMAFNIRVVVHEMLPFSEVNNGKTTAIDRYDTLCRKAGTTRKDNAKKPFVWLAGKNVQVCVTPCRVVAPQEAARLFAQGWADGKDTKRVIFEGEPYEGLVGIDPLSVHKGGRSNKWKFKPFHSVDVRITDLSKSDKGKTISYQINGEDIKSGEKVKLFTGISPELYEELTKAKQDYKEVVIEVEALAIKSLAHGNPTLKAIRYDKMIQNSQPGIE